MPRLAISRRQFLAAAASTPLWLRASQARADIVGHPSVTSVAIALEDCKALAPAYQTQRRYLQVPGEALEQRLETAAAISWLMNSVSRSRALRVTSQADPEFRLIRVDLAAYIDRRVKGQFKEMAEQWEALARTDPYWHVRPGIFNFESGEVAETIIDGPWLPAEYQELRRLTGSRGPILRADWFLAKVSSAPTYYGWSGIPDTEAAFFKSLGIDTKGIEALASDTGANFLSAFTHKGRRVIYRPGPLGGSWQTLDSATETPDRDPIRNPIDKGNQKLIHDASEHFAMGANKLWRVAVFDGGGKRLDAVAQAVAVDDMRQDGTVRPLVSCAVCHQVRGTAGLQPFADLQTILPLGPGTDLEVRQRIGEFYEPARHQIEMSRDGQDYSRAVAEVTGGMTAEEIGRVVNALYHDHVEAKVDLPKAAAENGLTVEAARVAWGPSEDPTISLLLRDQPQTRTAYETVFSELASRAVLHEPAKMP